MVRRWLVMLGFVFAVGCGSTDFCKKSGAIAEDCGRYIRECVDSKVWTCDADSTEIVKR